MLLDHVASVSSRSLASLVASSLPTSTRLLWMPSAGSSWQPTLAGSHSKTSLSSCSTPRPTAGLSRNLPSVCLRVVFLCCYGNTNDGSLLVFESDALVAQQTEAVEKVVHTLEHEGPKSGSTVAHHQV